MQLLALERAFPQGNGFVKCDRLTWTCVVQPAPEADEYEIVVDLTRARTPDVNVVSPRLGGPGPIPHTYSGTRLCLFLPGAWSHKMLLADTIVPWAIEWLYFYEIWAAGGGWHGGGVHPNGPSARSGRPNATSARRVARRSRYRRSLKTDRRRLREAMARLPGRRVEELENLPGRSALDS